MAMRIDILNKAKDNVAGTAVENVEISLRSTSNGIEKPESIENQINTSIMQTLKAIDIKNMAKLELEEKLQKKSDGLFSRFRKSSCQKNFFPIIDPRNPLVRHSPVL